MTDDTQDIGHEIGEHNIQVFGFDIHQPVFLISAILAVTVVIATLMFQEQAAVFFADIRSWITVNFDWFLQFLRTFLFCFVL